MRKRSAVILTAFVSLLAFETAPAQDVTKILQNGRDGYSGFGDCYFHTTDGNGDFNEWGGADPVDEVNGEFVWFGGGG